MLVINHGTFLLIKILYDNSLMQYLIPKIVKIKNQNKILFRNKFNYLFIKSAKRE